MEERDHQRVDVPASFPIAGWHMPLLQVGHHMEWTQAFHILPTPSEQTIEKR